MKKQPDKDEDYKPVSDILQEFVKKNRLQNGLDNVNLNALWKKEMGSVISKYTTHIALKRGTLYVELSSSTLRHELGYGKDKIIRILNEAMQREVIQKLVLR